MFLAIILKIVGNRVWPAEIKLSKLESKSIGRHLLFVQQGETQITITIGNWHPSTTTLSMIIYHQYLRQSGFTRYLVHYHIMPRPPPVGRTISGEKTNTGNHHHIPNNIINDNQYLHQGPHQIFSPSSLFVHSLERTPTGRTLNHHRIASPTILSIIISI